MRARTPEDRHWERLFLLLMLVNVPLVFAVYGSVLLLAPGLQYSPPYPYPRLAPLLVLPSVALATLAGNWVALTGPPGRIGPFGFLARAVVGGLSAGFVFALAFLTPPLFLALSWGAVPVILSAMTVAMGAGAVVALLVGVVDVFVLRAVHPRGAPRVPAA